MVEQEVASLCFPLLPFCIPFASLCFLFSSKKKGSSFDYGRLKKGSKREAMLKNHENMKIHQYTIRSQDGIFVFKRSHPGSAMVPASKTHKIQCFLIFQSFRVRYHCRARMGSHIPSQLTVLRETICHFLNSYRCYVTLEFQNTEKIWNSKIL